MSGKASLIKRIAYRITVPKCVSCKRILQLDQRAVCSNCYSEYLNTKDRSCSRCARPLESCFCTNEYLKNHFVKGLIKVFRYRVSPDNCVANSLIFRMKKRSRKDVTDFFSDELIIAMKNSISDFSDTVITNVPNRKSEIRERGMDHAAVLAKAVAQKLGIEYRPLLVSLSKYSQKNLTAAERLINADFDLITDESLKGKTVIIIDDIVTTGASMGKSATMIKALCPKRIIGACLAIAYFDK